MLTKGLSYISWATAATVLEGEEALVCNAALNCIIAQKPFLTGSPEDALYWLQPSVTMNMRNYLIFMQQNVTNHVTGSISNISRILFCLTCRTDARLMNINCSRHVSIVKYVLE